jgi:hypothetical protein
MFLTASEAHKRHSAIQVGRESGMCFTTGTVAVHVSQHNGAIMRVERRRKVP